MLTLKDVKPGKTVKVIRIHGEGPVKQRIMAMGITRNTEILIRKAAPLGDPVEIKVRGYELSLRRADIDIIEVAE
jgi:ferrous iron transport protein A